MPVFLYSFVKVNFVWRQFKALRFLCTEFGWHIFNEKYNTQQISDQYNTQQISDQYKIPFKNRQAILWKGEAQMLQLIIGIALIIFAVSSFFICVARTPDHLQGYYGLMYGVIALGSLIGGAVLILSYIGII